ncbi:MAG TPA: sensor domain-containing diguanylate cyclase [Xanthomonadaceae bacterium]|nr:sensor domain-containing diguanylate cyclase [Xanthomonadaceae bacterium]
MTTRYRRLGIYVGILVATTLVAVAGGLSGAPAFPGPLVFVACMAACLFVWQFGLPHPRVGLLSLERLPQIGLLLTFEPVVAATICAVASLIWPYLNPGYSQGSLKVATLRALHNAAMTALMLLAGGHAYRALGGRFPLDALAMTDLLPLAAMALAVQVVNLGLMFLYYRLDGREVGALLTPFYVLVDLLFVPAGVLAALLFNTGALAAFSLFLLLMLVFVMSFNGLAANLSKADAGESGHFRAARRIDELAEQILRETRVLLRFDEFYLAVVDSERGEFDIRFNERQGRREPRRCKPLTSGLFGWVYQHATPLLIENWEKAPEMLRRRAEITPKETGSAIFVPLCDGDSVIGLLSVQHTVPGAFSPADLHLLERLARRAAPALADARAFEALEDYRQRLEERVTERTSALEQANHEKELLLDALRLRSQNLERESLQDPLTGLANRRHFNQRLAAEIDLAGASNRPLALALADLDLFKDINDRLGHNIGDEVLRVLAELMHQHFRADDLLARIGGEEFAILLPGLGSREALNACERLRLGVANHPWTRIHPELGVTLSAGVADWQPHMSAEALLEAADVRLYRAKRGGRNRIEG